MKKIIFAVLIILIFISIYFSLNFFTLDKFKDDSKNESKELFSDYYTKAQKLLDTLNINEKIGQILLVRHPDTLDVTFQKDYQFGGILFFARDFKDKTKEEVIKMIQDLQKVSNIPILTAIDEEGGIVSRLSSNKNLVSVPFKSPQDLYKENGYQAIYDDVINKSNILTNLGLNLNLAPVVDVSTNKDDYIYKRTLGMDTEHTSIYAKTVIEASKMTKVSYTLKHFPGYGSNKDTHITSSIDDKTYEDILKYDLPPFIAGIASGAEAVMVSHNIISSIDNINPSSLSLPVHNILLQDLNFKGIIITDDISMNALKDIDDIEIKAIKAGNDLLITSDYEKSFNNIKKALENNTISEEEINSKVLKILAWKYYKKLI